MNWAIGFFNRFLRPRQRDSILRAELFALLPLFLVAVGAFSNRSIAELIGIVLPLLLAIDVVATSRSRMARRQEVNQPKDPITRLPQREALDVAVTQAADTSPQLTTACMFIRLDGQNELLERWGASGRDEILRRTAERLRTALRSDDTVARVEDGTFGVVLRPVLIERLDDVLSLTERLSRALAEPMYFGGGIVHTSASIGVATPETLELDELLAGAEAALSQAMRSGPGSIQRFSSDLRDRLSRQSALIRSVDTGFANSEIRAWFQPQINTDTGEISGFEALARWQHPQLGTLAPGEFLEAVRHAGRMPALGHTMLEQALAAITFWDRKKLKVPTVSVNFSPDELRERGMVERVKWEVDRHNLAPERLTIEILESVAALSNDDIILRNIDGLRSHGFRMDLDDFGTGQASIANLRRFGVQRIKIDRSFVTELDQDEEQRSIVAAILSLAEHLKVETVAEGVETQAEHATLAQLGCDHVQGFGVSKPMPFDQTFAWINQHRERIQKPPQIGRKTG
ncbi:MAG: bifunctional diguanylate cyclase/phosphodiesterase [Pseudomonadota bacterium]